MSPNKFLEEWIDGTIIYRKTPVSTPSFVWNFYDSCLQLLISAVPLLPSIKASASTLESFKGELGRLFAWGDGFENGKLDDTLESAPELRMAILEFLVELGSILSSKLIATLRHNNPNSTTLEREAAQLRLHVEDAKNMVYDGEDLDNDSESDLSLGDSIHTITAEVRFYVNRLMDLLPSLERTSINSNKITEMSAPVGILFQVSEPAHSYILNIRDKFPNADQNLVERLGEANWQRHERIRGRDTGTTDLVWVDVKTVFKPVSMFHDSGLGSSVPGQSSYEISIASHSSFKTGMSEGQAGNYRVPPTPKEVFSGNPFVCEICGHLLNNIRSRVDWKIHVFTDLRPYICTFPSCSEGHNTFPTRRMWEKHEFTKHRVNKHWKCYQCRLQFQTPSEWENHVKNVHGIVFSISQRDSAMTIAETSKTQAIEIQKCPLCLKQGMKMQREFTTHVAKHMEAIALATLPLDPDTDSEHSCTASNDGDSESKGNGGDASTATENRATKSDVVELKDSFLDDDDDCCPLCVEDFDLADLGFRPCPCGYHICQFCFNNIRENMNGLCPACRRPYNEKTVEWRVISPKKAAQFNAKSKRGLNRSKRNDEKGRKARSRKS